MNKNTKALVVSAIISGFVAGNVMANDHNAAAADHADAPAKAKTAKKGKEAKAAHAKKKGACKGESGCNGHAEGHDEKTAH